METETIVGLITIGLLALSQVAALLGKPKWVANIKLLDKVFNVLAGNYGKARNRHD